MDNKNKRLQKENAKELDLHIFKGQLDSDPNLRCRQPSLDFAPGASLIAERDDRSTSHPNFSHIF
jgi:hypothetical protein